MTRLPELIFRAWCIVVIALFVALGASTAHADTSPLGTSPTCANGGVPMGAQTWDITPSLDMPKHIHTEVCFPMLQTLDQPVAVDVRTLLHDNDGTATLVRWQDGSSTKQTLKMSYTPGVTLAASRVDQLTIDPAQFDHSGWREVRITSNVIDPVKGRWYTTARYCVFVVNGKSRQDYCGGPTTSGRCGWAGWYGQYMNVYADCRDYWKAITRPLVAGDTIRIKADGQRTIATIDPNFHATPENDGQVIYDGPATKWVTVTIPPGLAPGVHKLHIRTIRTRTSKPAGTFAGAGVLTFTVGS